ncbi:MAG: aminopeptidase P N-terminal domain-containing protein [Polyangiaceae bacterium]
MMFAKRRNALFDKMAARRKDSVLLLSATPHYLRNADTEHEYRQDSDLYYLSGFIEPRTVLLMDAETRKLVLFVPPRDPDREVWDGPRAGVDGALSRFGADEAYDVADFDKELPKYLKNRTVLYYRIAKDSEMDRRVFAAVQKTYAMSRSGAYYPTEIIDPGTLLHEARIRKEPEEIDLMQKAANISAEAHMRAMAATKPGMHEYEIEAILLDHFRKNGSERVAYGCIVGSGPNATILHYRSNDRKMNPGELLLIDAGCEYGYYASDITRTFPVSGKFTKAQAEVYEVVLEAQLAGIDLARVGGSIDAIHKCCVEKLTSGMKQLGILDGDVDALIAEEKYKPFYMHRTSHWLGMDVHDAGAYYVDGRSRPLEPGMALTIEPGLYFSAQDTRVPEAYRGIGVRIEDDIVVTEAGPRNLTAAVPKTVAEIEKCCAG